MKRALDILGSGGALLVLSPVFAVVAAAVAGTSPGEVFFRGERVGQHGRPFRIFKFRSMEVNSEGAGTWNVGMNDVRVTKVGKILRATKLDELPQFINVLRGEMSLVGPRPELAYYVNMYSEAESCILLAKPGITDWASLVNYSQHKGFTAASDPDAHYLTNVRPLKLHLELYYLDHQSLWQDLRILAWTVRGFVRGDGRVPADVQREIESFKENPSPTRNSEYGYSLKQGSAGSIATAQVVGQP